MRQIMKRLPQHDETNIVWDRLHYYVLRVSDPTSWLYLRLTYDYARPQLDDGWQLLEPDELLILEKDRADCERRLADECPCEVTWTALARIYMISDAVHREFGAAYTAATGWPSEAPPAVAPETIRPGRTGDTQLDAILDEIDAEIATLGMV